MQPGACFQVCGATPLVLGLHVLQGKLGPSPLGRVPWCTQGSTVGWRRRWVLGQSPVHYHDRGRQWAFVVGQLPAACWVLFHTVRRETIHSEIYEGNTVF